MVALAVMLALLVVSVGSCSRAEEPQASPTSASPTQTREPAEPLEAVDGQVEVETVSVHAGEPVFNPGAPQAAEPDVDTAAVDAFAEEIASWLDDHLDGLQQGGSGALEQVAAPGLLESDSRNATIGVTTALASPDRPVDGATYAVTVAVDGGPQWATVHVVVTPREGDPSAAQFTFTPGEEGPILEAAGPADIDDDEEES